MNLFIFFIVMVLLFSGRERQKANVIFMWKEGCTVRLGRRHAVPFRDRFLYHLFRKTKKHVSNLFVNLYGYMGIENWPSGIITPHGVETAWPEMTLHSPLGILHKNTTPVDMAQTRTFVPWCQRNHWNKWIEVISSITVAHYLGNNNPLPPPATSEARFDVFLL